MEDTGTPSQDRGQAAARPAEIPAIGWRDILVRLYTKVVEDHVVVVAAGVAFFGLLAIFPTIGAIVSIAGYVLDPVEVSDLLSGLFRILPESAAAILQDQLTAAAGASETATGLGAIFSIILALYGAMKGVKTLMEGINIAYQETEKRNVLMLNLVAVGLTVLLILGFLIAVAAILVIPVIAAFLGLPPAIEALINVAKWSLLSLATVLGLAVIYRYGPSRRKPKWRWVSPGAVAATALWLVGTVGFSIYAQNFANYNETYGTIGGVIALLMWLWLSAIIVLLGAELDAEMEHQTFHDTTAGRTRPMGNRGAVKADTIPAGLPQPPWADAAKGLPLRTRPRRRGVGWVSTTALGAYALMSAFWNRRG